MPEDRLAERLAQARRLASETRLDRLEEVLARFPDRVVFIGGGPPVWDTYAPYIRHWDINRLPYDGDADRWFNPAWLIASETRA